MAWTGVSMSLGILLAVVGGLALVIGAGVAVVGPEAVDDEQAEDESFSLFGSGEDSSEGAQDRQEVRAGGAAIAAGGAALTLIGGLLYAVARGVEANRQTSAEQG